MEKHKQIANLRIEGSSTRKIPIDAHWKTGQTEMPVIIFCHGFKGFKDWGAWDRVADYFAEQGFCFIKFNFSFNGSNLENPGDLTELDVFAENNYSKELKDLQMVMNWVRFTQILPKDRMTNDIHLIGHSRGGGIAILAAAQDLRVTSVASWAAVSDFDARMPKGQELKDWKANDVRYIKNGRTGIDMPQGFQFYLDFAKHKQQFNIKKHAKSIEIPTLIVHGKTDEAVDVSEAKALKKYIKNADLALIEDCGHTFNTRFEQPEDEPLPLAMEEVMALTKMFFAKYSVQLTH